MRLQRSTRAVDVLVVLLVSGKPVVHLTARISADLGELDRPSVAGWRWNALRGAFPDALAATLMPDHPHVLTPCVDPDSAVVRLNRLLGQLGRRLEVPGRSGIVAPARVISSQAELRRQLRYVALNAPRAGLVDCPLAWIWSTHRDVVGAIADPWVTSDRLAGALRRPDLVSSCATTRT